MMGKVVLLDVSPWSFNKEVIVELDSVVVLVDVVVVVCSLSSKVEGVEDPVKLLGSDEVGRVAVIRSWVSDTDVLVAVDELLGSATEMWSLPLWDRAEVVDGHNIDP